jgi:sugar phosphate isomerase/epimerase
MKIGIRLESLALPLRRALLEAQRLGVLGVQLDAVGELSPKQLSQSGRRELRNLLRAYSVELTAIGCPLRHGLNVAENLDARIEHVRQVMTLSFELGPRLVILQAGAIETEKLGPSMNLLRESLLALSQHGDRCGTMLALETGLESGATLATYLATFDTGSLTVNFDPANLVMHGFDPYAALAELNRRIVHVHAKDARSSSASRAAAEVPLGHGDLDWMRLVDLLREREYRGWLTVERESGTQGAADVAAGVALLRRLAG